MVASFSFGENRTGLVEPESGRGAVAVRRAGSSNRAVRHELERAPLRPESFALERVVGVRP